MPEPQAQSHKRKVASVNGGSTFLPPEKRKSYRDSVANMQFRGTELQMRFIEEWAAGNSVNAAAMRAGYKDGGAAAYVLCTRPEVLAIYTKKVRAREVAAQITNKKFMDMLMEAYDMAKLQAEPMTMVAAAREIGKACGYYAPVERKIHVEGNVVLDRINRMSDQDLAAILNTPEPQSAQQQIENAVQESVQEIERDEEADDRGFDGPGAS